MNAEEHVRQWLTEERAYTIAKFGIEQDDEHITDDHASSISDGWWQQQFDNYYHRAEVLGLDTPVGRQALAKFVATAVGMLEATVRKFGPLPKPGVPSGEIHPVHKQD